MEVNLSADIRTRYGKERRGLLRSGGKRCEGNLFGLRLWRGPLRGASYDLVRLAY
jgi:hypothetical protein